MKHLLRHPSIQAMLAWLLGLYLWFALRTTRWVVDGEEHAAPYLAGQPVVAAFWHERLVLMPELWRRASGRRQNAARMHVLVSRHRDGRFIGRVLRRFGVDGVLGSSSRGGAAGARALLGLLAAGEQIVITPDGPRGPRRVAAPGVAQLAALSGVPVLPCSAQISRRRVMRSWDRMVIPLPFGRGVIACGTPITVSRRDWQAAIPRIEAALNAAADRADFLCPPRVPPSGPRVTHPLQTAWSLAANLAAPALRLLIHRRLGRGKEWPGRTDERFGIDPTPRPAGKLIWLHAASVGETVSVLPVISALPAGVSVLLTTGTVTSATLLAARLPELGLAGRVTHRFVPLDVPGWVARFLDHWRPDVAGFVESELWPNLLAGCRARHIPVMLINARMSERSFASWLRLPGFARHVLSGFALIQAQTETYAERFRQLGGEHVTAPGDLKFAAPELPVDRAELDRLRSRLTGRPVWLAASTHPGEDEVVFAAHRKLAAAHPRLLTILAPRHPERGERIVGMAGDVPATRRALGQGPPDAGVWIADTLGELGLFCRLAPIVFVGRSLVPPGGGQNPLEPARLGCAVAVGPYTGNFEAATEILHDAGALARASDAASLAGWIDALLRDPVLLAATGVAAAAASGRYADLPACIAAYLVSLRAA